MKATLNTADLKAYLKAAKPFVSNKVIPILETVQVLAMDGAIKLTVTDLDNYLIHVIPAADVIQGYCCIPFADLLNFVNSYQDRFITIEGMDNDMVNIGGLKMQGTGHEVNDEGEPTNLFPLCPELEKTESLTFSSLLFHEIETGIRFAGTDETRPAMSGLFIGTYDNKLTIACTDAHSLYRGEIATLKKDFGIIVNGMAARNLPKIAALIGDKGGDVDVEWNETNVVFSQGNYRLISRLIDAKYPAINAVIPKDNPIQATFNKAAMLKAIERVKIAANPAGKQVMLDIKDGDMQLTCRDLDMNKEMQTSIPCTLTGDPIEIAFNHSFLTELLKALVSPDVTLELSAGNRAGLLCEFHRTFLLMPVMIVKPEPEAEVEPEMEEEEEVEEEA